MDSAKYNKFKEIHLIEIPQGHLVWKFGTGDNIELFDIEVEEKQKGYGTQLVKMLLEAVAQYHPSSIYGFTAGNNIVAQSFYRALGFESVPLGDLYKNKAGVIFFWQNYKELCEKLL